MPIIEGSMNHTYSGRRKKRIIRSKKAKVQFFQLDRDEPTIRETPNYPSAPMTPYRPAKDETYKQEVSAGYTIAPAYNKGAYQVISAESVEDIGRQMILGFLLVVIIEGTPVVTEDMYFNDINRCNYFAYKVQTGSFKDDKYPYLYTQNIITAYCLPKMVEEDTKFWD